MFVIWWINSSLISAIFAENSSKKIQTITVGFDGEGKNHDERYYASKVSKFLNSEHQEVVNPNSFVKLDRIFENLCEPCS